MFSFQNLNWLPLAILLIEIQFHSNQDMMGSKIMQTNNIDIYSVLVILLKF